MLCALFCFFSATECKPARLDFRHQDSLESQQKEFSRVRVLGFWERGREGEQLTGRVWGCNCGTVWWVSFQIWVWKVTFNYVFLLDRFRFDSFLFLVFGFSIKMFFFSQFCRFGYKMLLLIECFCWVGLDLIRFCFGFLDSLSKCLFSQI